MVEPFIEEWIELIRPLFPNDARIETDAGDDVVLRIDWKLGSDPDRPNKRSRLIRVIIPREAITDCHDFKTAGSRFRKIIQDRLSVFNPDHDIPKYGSPPIEEWVISTFDVN